MISYIIILFVISFILLLLQWAFPTGIVALMLHGLTSLPVLALGYLTTFQLPNRMPCMIGDATGCKVRRILLYIIGILFLIHGILTLYRAIADAIKGTKPVTIYPGTPAKKRYLIHTITAKSVDGDLVKLDVDRKQFQRMTASKEVSIKAWYWPRTKILNRIIVENEII